MQWCIKGVTHQSTSFFCTITTILMYSHHRQHGIGGHIVAPRVRKYTINVRGVGRTATCRSCYQKNCQREQNHHVYCTNCHRSFYGPNCYDTHKLGAQGGRLEQRQPICEKVLVRVQCRLPVSLVKCAPGNVHRCGESICNQSENKRFVKPHKISQTELTANMGAEFLFFFSLRMSTIRVY